MPYIKKEEWEQYDRNFTNVWISEMKAKASLSRYKAIAFISICLNMWLSYPVIMGWFA
jgi:hypothetical protein